MVFRLNSSAKILCCCFDRLKAAFDNSDSVFRPYLYLILITDVKFEHRIVCENKIIKKT